jgi:hypothetical protein
MSIKTDLLARFTGQAGEGPMYLPDLTLWYEWHAGRGTLPEGWHGYSLPQVARALGVPIWAVARPWRVETAGVNLVKTATADERVLRIETDHGNLTSRWTLGPDGDWWHTEYPVKSANDLDAALAWARAQTYMLDANDLARQGAEIGEDGVLALELPRRPYSDLLHEFLGWSEGLTLLNKPAVKEINAVLEAKLQDLVQQIAKLPGEVVLSPDNWDGQFVSPRAFERYLDASYRQTSETLHTAGKRLVVHVGGPMGRLIGPLAEAGVDAVEGVSGPPQSDTPLAQAREIVGPDLTLWGGIAQDFLLNTRAPEELQTEVKQAVQAARGDDRILLGVADRVPVDADLGRLQALPALIEEA